MWDLIISVPDHCLSFYLDFLSCLLKQCKGRFQCAFMAFLLAT